MIKYFATYCLFVCKDPYKDQHFDNQLNVLGDPQRIRVHMLLLLRIKCGNTLLSYSLYSRFLSTINILFLSLPYQLVSHLNTKFKPWNRRILRVSGRHYSLLLCG